MNYLQYSISEPGHEIRVHVAMYVCKMKIMYANLVCMFVCKLLKSRSVHSSLKMYTELSP